VERCLAGDPFGLASEARSIYSCPMRSLIQRVTEAAVVVDGKTVGEVGAGVLVLLGIEAADTREDIEWIAGKIARLRIFPDAAGAMNQSVTDIGGQALVVPQFTLFASTKKGNRPSFIRAAPRSLRSACTPIFARNSKCCSGNPFNEECSVRICRSSSSMMAPSRSGSIPSRRSSGVAE